MLTPYLSFWDWEHEDNRLGIVVTGNSGPTQCFEFSVFKHSKLMAWVWGVVVVVVGGGGGEVIPNLKSSKAACLSWSPVKKEKKKKISTLLAPVVILIKTIASFTI